MFSLSSSTIERARLRLFPGFVYNLRADAALEFVCDELWVHIFLQLAPYERLVAARVCREWARILHDPAFWAPHEVWVAMPFELQRAVDETSNDAASLSCLSRTLYRQWLSEQASAGCLQASRSAHASSSGPDLIKMIVLGAASIGKTQLTNRFGEDTFSTEYLITIGVDFKVRVAAIGPAHNERRVKYQIWDTAGQERFRSISRDYVRGAHAILLCFSLNSPESLRELSSLLPTVRQWSPPSGDRIVILVGLKSDLPRRVSAEDISEFCRGENLSVPFMACSALTNDGVERVFRTAAYQCVFGLQRPCDTAIPAALLPKPAPSPRATELLAAWSAELVSASASLVARGAASMSWK